MVRESRARTRLPVLMATSDRGLIDVERFDLEPGRPILHGLLGELDAATLAGMDSRDKIPHILRHLDGASLSARAAASIGRGGSDPGDVAATGRRRDHRRHRGRRGGTPNRPGRALRSGRVRIDVGGALDDLDRPRRQPSTRARRSTNSDDRDAHRTRAIPIHAIVVGRHPGAIGRQRATLVHRVGPGLDTDPAGARVHVPGSTSDCAAAQWPSVPQSSTRRSRRPPTGSCGRVEFNERGTTSGRRHAGRRRRRRAGRAVPGADSRARPTGDRERPRRSPPQTPERAAAAASTRKAHGWGCSSTAP